MYHTSTPTAYRLVVADSDKSRADMLVKLLRLQGHLVSFSDDSRSLMYRLGGDHFDLLIAHEELRPADTENLCKELRARGWSLPILMLTNSDHFSRRVINLQAGADDVLSIPYAIEELLARLSALVRRSRMSFEECAGSILSYADLIVETDNRVVTRAGQSIKLSVKEYDLLLCLLRHRQQILPRQRILHLVWGDTWVGDDNLLDVYIRYLRKKIERPDLEPLIHTVRGVGFVLK